jgi:hypothetical protein
VKKGEEKKNAVSLFWYPSAYKKKERERRKQDPVVK